MRTSPASLGLLLSASLVLFVPSPATAQIVGGAVEGHFQLTGSNPVGNFGKAVAGGGDFDGDGVPDFLVGANKDTSGGIGEDGLVEIRSGVDASLLGSYTGNRWDRLGVALAWAGDLDGDGRDDFVVGAPLGLAANGGGVLAGRVYVYSTLAGGVSLILHGSAHADRFGHAVAAGADLDGDGVGDLLVGAPGVDGSAGVNSGEVMAFSGATGAQLLSVQGRLLGESCGSSVAFIGDLDGDGISDILIGSPDGNHHDGAVHAVSGATGQAIYTLSGSGGEKLGFSLASLGDTDGDGVDDFLVGAPLANGVGAAYLCSGATGTQILQIDGLNGESLGVSVGDAGDFDGDGAADLFVGVLPWAATSGTSALRIYGTDGTYLRELTTGLVDDHFGLSASVIGDLDGNGTSELVIGAHQGASGDGVVYVKGFNPILYTTAESLSASAGGTIDVTIDFPDSEAGQHYALLVGFSGTATSTFAGLDIPLAQDVMFNRMVNGDPPRHFVNPYGVLDANGNAVAQYIGQPLWLLPRLGETFNGVVISHDFVSARMVSIPRPCLILP